MKKQRRIGTVIACLAICLGIIAGATNLMGGGTAFADEPPEFSFDVELYNELDLGLEAWGYWNATDVRHFKRITTEPDCINFIATAERFTKEQIPVGSIIQLKEGFKYRPEGWLTNAQLDPTLRPDYVTDEYVEVTEEWWGDFTMRAFNITAAGAPQEFEDNDAIQDVLTIYVPKSSANLITRIEIGTRVGAISGTTITVSMPHDTDLTEVIVRVFTSEGSTYAPSTASAWDISSPVQITVTAENGAQRVYTLTATLEEAPAPPAPEDGCPKGATIPLASVLIAAAFVGIKRLF